MRQRVQLVLALLLTLVAVHANEAALEVRLGPGLFADIEIYINALVPNLTAALLPLPLPAQNKTLLNVEVQLTELSLVDLQVNGVEVSLNTAAPGFMVAIKTISFALNYTLTYRILPFGWKTLSNLQASSDDAEAGIVFTILAPVPRLSIYQSEYSFVNPGSLKLGIHDSLLLELLQPVLELVIGDLVKKDVPKQVFPLIENQTAPLLVKLVDPISLGPLIFCPATLNVSLTNAPIYTEETALLSLSATISSPTGVCQVASANYTWDTEPAALEIAISAAFFDCFYTLCNPAWGELLNLVAGAKLPPTDSRVKLTLALMPDGAFIVFHPGQIAVSLPLEASFTLPVYSATTPLITIPITLSTALNNFTAAQDHINTSLVIVDAAIALPDLQLLMPTLLAGADVPASFADSLANSNLTQLSAQALALLAPILGPLIASGVHHNITLPSLPFPPRMLQLEAREGYLYASANLDSPTTEEK